ncbi:MAG: DegV family protein, partial [Chloroflexi bacterium]
MARSFAVVTDSTADLPGEWRKRYGIEVVPLKVLFGHETFRDGV